MFYVCGESLRPAGPILSQSAPPPSTPQILPSSSRSLSVVLEFPFCCFSCGVPGKTPGDAATRLVCMPRPYSDLLCSNVITSVSGRRKEKKRKSVAVIALLYTERRRRARRRNRGRRFNRDRSSYCTQYVTI